MQHSTRMAIRMVPGFYKDGHRLGFVLEKDSPLTSSIYGTIQYDVNIQCGWTSVVPAFYVNGHKKSCGGIRDKYGQVVSYHKGFVGIWFLSVHTIPTVLSWIKTSKNNMYPRDTHVIKLAKLYTYYGMLTGRNGTLV